MKRAMLASLLAGVAMVFGVLTSPAVAQEGIEERIEALQEEIDELKGRIAEPAGSDFRLDWKEGIRLDSADGAFKLKIGGRIMNDWAWMSQDDEIETAVGELEDGTEFRRARLYVEGTIYERMIFKAQYDFAGGDADFKDVYIGLKKLPTLGTLKVGHFKEPFSLEELTSSKYITFMERSLPIAFAPSRNTGIGVMNAVLDKRMTWALGIFRDTDSFGDGAGDGGGYSFTTRVTGLPWYEDKGRKLLHLGFAWSRRDPEDDVVRFSQRPEVHLAPRFVDTEEFAATQIDLLGVETALVYGPASVQGEYIHADVETRSGSDPDFSGFYVTGSYFLTGEHRKYKESSGAFSRVKPKNNFLDGKGGLGAWELAVRYSEIDLDDRDAGILGGELHDFTFGINWHLNPNARVMLNYVLSELEGVGDADLVGMRFQVDF